MTLICLWQIGALWVFKPAIKPFKLMFHFISFIYRPKNATEQNVRCVGGKRLMLCKITVDLGYDVPRLVLGTKFVGRVILSPGFRNICFSWDILQSRGSSVVCCSVLWCACVSPVSESIFANFLGAVELHHNCFMSLHFESWTNNRHIQIASKR